MTILFTILGLLGILVLLFAPIREPKYDVLGFFLIIVSIAGLVKIIYECH